MIEAYITALKPPEVAAEVEAARRGGCMTFRLRAVDGGGMLDQERLGAARYAAGIQSRVELDLAVVEPGAARRR
jgi:hypothetical protein